MTAPSQLAKWREGRHLTPRQAARRMALSIETYNAIERGDFECGPSLAMDIAKRTGYVVMPGDLPGAATLDIEASPGRPIDQAQADAIHGDTGSASKGAEAPLPASAPVYHLLPLGRIAGVLGGFESIRFGAPSSPASAPIDEEAPCNASSSPDTWSTALVRRQIGASDAYLVALTPEGGADRPALFELEPRAACELGVQLVRAALLATKPGAVPV
jgi:transcriptional regulator with XRE-family HTH domain